MLIVLGAVLVALLVVGIAIFAVFVTLKLVRSPKFEADLDTRGNQEEQEYATIQPGVEQNTSLYARGNREDKEYATIQPVVEQNTNFYARGNQEDQEYATIQHVVEQNITQTAHSSEANFRPEQSSI